MILVIVLFEYIYSFYIYVVYPDPGTRLGYDKEGRLQTHLGRNNLLKVIISPPGTIKKNIILESGDAVRFNKVDKMFYGVPLLKDDKYQQFVLYGIEKNRFVFGQDELCVGLNENHYLTLVDCSDQVNKMVFEIEDEELPYRSAY